MVHHSGKRSNQWSPPLCEVYKLSDVHKWKEKWLPSGSNRQYDSTHMVIVNILATTTRHAKTANGKISIYIIGSIADHGHLKTNVL